MQPRNKVAEGKFTGRIKLEKYTGPGAAVLNEAEKKRDAQRWVCNITFLFHP